MNSNEPLAYRMRPKTLDEYVGQEHVLGKDNIEQLKQIDYQASYYLDLLDVVKHH